MPSVRSVGALSEGADACALPAGLAEGDRMVAILIHRGGVSSNPPTYTAPGGWTLDGQVTRLLTSTFILSITQYSKYAGASESTPDFTPSFYNRGYWNFMIAVQDPHDTTWLDGSLVLDTGAGSATADFTMSNPVTGADDSLVVQVAMAGNDIAIDLKTGSEQSFTSEATFDSSYETDMSAAVASREVATAGTVTSPTFEGIANATYIGLAFMAAVAGAAGFTGTSATTLAAFTSTASGTVTLPAVTGTATPTLDPFTSTASGTSTAVGVAGSAAVNLEDATSTASGTVTAPAVTGSAAITLEDATSTAAGTLLVVPGTFSLSDVVALYDGRNLPGTVGDDITAWDDETPNGYDLAEDATTGTTNPPSITESYFGGVRAALFDDTNLETLEFDNGSNILTGDLGFIIVVEIVSRVGSLANVVMSAPDGGEASSYKHILGIDDDGSGDQWVLMSGGGGAAHRFFGSVSAGQRSVVMEYISNTGNETAWDNLTEYDVGNSGSNDLRGWRFGTRETDDFPSNMALGYVLIVDMDSYTAADLEAARTDVASWFNVALGVVGTSSQTLEAFTSAASGTVTAPAVTGTAAVTLDDHTSTAAGTVSAPGVTGTAAVTLEDATSTATGTVTAPAVTGSAAVTLEDHTSAASGASAAPGVTGTSTQTLDDHTSTAAGTVTAPSITGTVAATLENHDSTAAGLVAAPGVSGSSATTLDAFTSTASGASAPPGVSGSSATTLDDHTSTASGTVTAPAVTGTSAVTLDNHTTTASGVVTAPAVTGTAAVTLEDATSTGSGAYSAAGVTGSSAPTLQDHTSAAAGTVTPPAVSGSVTVTLSDWTSTAAGNVTAPSITGTVAVTLDDHTSTASGTVTNTHGTAAPTLDDHTSAASGVVTAPAVTGTVAAVLDDMVSTAAGTFAGTVTGTAGTTLEDFTSTAAGISGQPYWWEKNPTSFGKAPAAHTKDPVSFVKIHGEDQSPW